MNANQIMDKIKIITRRKDEFINIDAELEKIITKNSYINGFLFIFTPHTTAAVTINENADPDVPRDIQNALKRMVPETGHAHAEGNSPAHIKSSIVGCSAQVIVLNSQLQLGTWQSVFFCEFDGPRQREVWISFLSKND